MTKPITYAVFAYLIAASVVAGELPANRYYAQEAFLVPLSDKANLQTRLNQHGAIRLEKGDYTAGNPLAKVILRSNNRIYGVGNNFPEVEVEPGTTNALVSSLHGKLTFPPSAVVTKENLFRHINYSTIRINGGTLESNLFHDTSFSSWRVDHSVSGSWRNNRILRFLNHSASPMLTIQSRAAAKNDNYGNVFLWVNSLGANSEIMNLAGQRDLTVVFMDCESYSESGGNAVTASAIDDLSFFGLYGSMKTGRAIDQAATSAWIHGQQLGVYVAPNLIQRAANTGSVLTNFMDTNAPTNEANPNANRYRLFRDNSQPAKTLLLNEAALPPALTAPQQSALLRATSTARTGTPWERPKFNPIPNPAGPNWNATLASKPSSRATIQTEIDTKGIAILAPGIYYLDGPLVLAAGQGLIGGGMDNTVLIAKSNTQDLIVGGPTGGANTILLADLTLQGGRSGIHHTTNGAQFTGSTLSHVTIRDMADSGIWLENIYAWDNNSIDYLNIFNCPSGIKQRAPTGPVSDATPTLTYLDKNVFYQCQFVSCAKALDLIGGRASNGNTWINCLFKDSTQFAVVARSHNTAIFANCDFLNNKGHPVVNVQGQLYLVSCAFDDNNSGATDYVDGIAINLEGCTFNRNAGSNVVITAPTPTWIDLTNPANNNEYRNHNSFFFNCRSTNVPINLMFSGLCVNSFFPDRPDLSIQAAIVTAQGATVTPLIPGAVTPANIKPQLLNGATFKSRMVSEVDDTPPPNNTPTLASGISATPNPATAGQSIAFSVSATDPDSDPLTYSWNFADGSQDAGPSVTHTFAQAGTYLVTVLIEDPRGGTIASELLVTVLPNNNGGGGGGIIPEGDADNDGVPNNQDDDMDGDGVSNANEAADGTNPLDAASVVKTPMTVSKIQGSAKFDTIDKDSIAISGIFPQIPALFDPSNSPIKVDIGGAHATFTLDAKGKSKTEAGSFAVSLKPATKNKTTRKLEFKGGPVKFKAKLIHGTWSDDWLDEGVDPTKSAKASPLALTVDLHFAGRIYTAEVQTLYSAKATKSGKFKK